MFPTWIRRFAIGIVVAVTVTAAMADAADLKTPVPKKVDAPLENAEVRFADGSVVHMRLTHSHIKVKTRYGVLEVPIEDIRRIDFANRVSAAESERIGQAVRDLAGNHEKNRDDASKTLVELGPLAHVALRRELHSTDDDFVKRVRLVMRQIEDAHDAEKLIVRDLDVLMTAEFTILGKVESPAVRGKTAYFGEVDVKLSEVKTIRFRSGSETELVIDAAKHAAITNDVWLDTEVDAVEGGSLQIKATGTVDLWPMGGNYKVGPDAHPQQGMAPDGHPAGVLVGRIGDRGKPFIVGSAYSKLAAESGRLYLRIASSPWNNPSSGIYKVSITSDAKKPATPAGPAKMNPVPMGEGQGAAPILKDSTKGDRR